MISLYQEHTIPPPKQTHIPDARPISHHATVTGHCIKRPGFRATLTCPGLTPAGLITLDKFRSVQEVKTDLRKWVKPWNENPNLLVWTKTPNEILESHGPFLKRTSDAGH